MRITTWTEIQRIVLRLLDIDCDVAKSNDISVRNPIKLYKHIRDDYNKSKIDESEVAYNLRWEFKDSEYTPGYRIIKKEEVIDWMLPGINPDVNTLSPLY